MEYLKTYLRTVVRKRHGVHVLVVGWDTSYSFFPATVNQNPKTYVKSQSPLQQYTHRARS